MLYTVENTASQCGILSAKWKVTAKKRGRLVPATDGARNTKKEGLPHWDAAERVGDHIGKRLYS